MITYTPNPKDKEVAQAEFRALSQAQGLMDAEGGAVSPSRLWAYAQSQLSDGFEDVLHALDQNPDMRKAYGAMIRSAAMYSFPEAMAAAEADTLPERAGQGCKLSLKPSRAEQTQLYLIIELADTSKKPKALVVSDKKDRTALLTLPQARDGIIQVIVEKNSDIVRLLKDPKSEAYLK
ncbi:hypothetical protein V5T82_14635 [Magnetovibrio sp. PR-2]|uniref:hypothetical protein n=1 Tax=Magnetovibrio sp. PR-2 TaxID=3120356 RepID=UPI002FCE1C53